MASVLVVEDDPAIRHLVRDLLREEGYDTEEAADGLVALEQVRRSVPDVVVLDLFMPRMDGEEFLNVSRLVPGCASLPVLILSASDRIPADKRVRAFLKKPFDLSVLAHAVRSVLGDGTAQPSASPA
jgi:CheY-like chemotaxis protein